MSAWDSMFTIAQVIHSAHLSVRCNTWPFFGTSAKQFLSKGYLDILFCMLCECLLLFVKVLICDVKAINQLRCSLFQPFFTSDCSTFSISSESVPFSRCFIKICFNLHGVLGPSNQFPCVRAPLGCLLVFQVFILLCYLDFYSCHQFFWQNWLRLMVQNRG